MSNFFPSTVDPVGPVNTVWHNVAGPLAGFVQARYMGFVQQQYIKFRNNVANSMLPFTQLEYVSEEIKITYMRNGDQERMHVYPSIVAVLRSLPSDLAYAFETPEQNPEEKTVTAAVYSPDTLPEDVRNVLLSGATNVDDPEGSGRRLSYINFDIIQYEAEVNQVTILEDQWQFRLQVSLSTPEEKTAQRQISPVTAFITSGTRLYYRTAYTIAYPEYPPVVKNFGQWGPNTYISDIPAQPAVDDIFYEDIPQEVLDQWPAIRSRSAARVSSMEGYLTAWNTSSYDVVYLPAATYDDWILPYDVFPYYVWLSPRIGVHERSESREIMYVYEPKQLLPSNVYSACYVTEVTNYNWPTATINLLVTPVKDFAARAQAAYAAVYDPENYNASAAEAAQWQALSEIPFALVGTFELQPPRPIVARIPGSVFYASWQDAIYVDRIQSTSGYGFIDFEQKPFGPPEVTEVGSETIL